MEKMLDGDELSELGSEPDPYGLGYRHGVRSRTTGEKLWADKIGTQRVAHESADAYEEGWLDGRHGRPARTS